MDNPCFGCKARHTRCHVDCKHYKAFRAMREAVNEASKRRIVAENDFNAVTARRFKRKPKREGRDEA